ncbi:hypothetical protein L484_010982 [Morus notabilis]|uniref:Kunitz-type serine protease inhibitor n=1 Tax=Morus notabilis TaxID=981085 RepID=W9R6T9_9ROSA|nr:kunitz-type serine protease inhibitor [Morus notabilis]EXB74705.1 hypothetical protein L484_010982 [Morus notabilis]
MSHIARRQYFGQENVSGPKDYPLIFAPFDDEEDVVRESRDLKITFSVSAVCIPSTTWQLVLGMWTKFQGPFRI